MEDQIIFKRILVAEDSAINQIFMQRALQKICTRIDIVDDGAKAVEMVRKNTYDLILMDLFMPEMDGYEATEIIRTTLKIKTPIIAITAVALPGEEQKCIDIGMNGYLIKPFTTEAILQLTRNKISTPELPVEEGHIFGDEEVTIDLKVLYALGDTTPDYIAMMMNVFIESLGKTIEDIKVLFEKKDLDALQKKAHFAKSSLSVVKINVLFELAKSIEIDCKLKVSPDVLNAKILQFEKLFNKAKNILNAYIEKIMLQKS